jgi:hypothetical protein
MASSKKIWLDSCHRICKALRFGKNEFVEKLPEVYEAAIILYFMDEGRNVRNSSITNAYLIYDEDTHEADTVMWINKIYDIALAKLVKNGFIVEVKHPFGPSLLNPSQDFDALLEVEQETNGSVVKILSAIDNLKEWLVEALATVSSWYAKLHITDEDFEKDDDSWEPIPIDR